MKLRTKMILLCICACLIPMLLVSTISLAIMQHQLKSTIQCAVDSYGSQLSLSLDAMITASDQLTKSFLLDTDLLTLLRKENPSLSQKIDRDTKVKQQLLRSCIISSQMEDALLVTLDHDVVAYSRTDNPVSVSRLLQESWFQDLLQSEHVLSFSPIHTQPYFERLPQNQVITISRKLYDTTGYPCGYLMFEYPPSYLFPYNSAFSGMQETYGLSICVYNADGINIYGDPPVLSEPLGIDYQYVNEKSGLSIIITAAHGSVFRVPLYLRKFCTVIFALALLASLASVLLITHKLTARFHTLEQAMQSSGEGSYVTVSPVQGKDEIAHVTQIYNEMIAREEGLVKEVYQSQIEQEKAKLLALRSQVNPHMLFNTLESIRMTALVSGDEKVSDMIQTLSEMFRLSLEDNKAHTIRDEIAYTKAFLDLQNMRFDDRFVLTVHMPEDLLEQSIISLVFQPVVENSISHGCRRDLSQLHLEIAADVQQDTIAIDVMDDGCGMPEEQLQKLNRYIHGESQERPDRSSVKSHGIGLINIHERLQLQYGKDYGIHITSTENQGTTVHIRIPYHPEKEVLS